MAITRTKLKLTNTTTGEIKEYTRNGAVSAFDVDDLSPYTTYSAITTFFYGEGIWASSTSPSSPVTFTTLPASQSSHPTSYDNDGQYYSLSNPEGAYTEPATGTGYADVYLTRGAGAATYIYWDFGDINIPTDATILSVTCEFRARIETAVNARIPIHTAQMYAGTTTAKGTAITVGASAANYTFTFNSGDWTAAELNNAKLKLYAERGTENVTNNYGYRIYGATLTVEYY